MSQQLSVVQSSVTDNHTFSGDAASYNPALAGFTVFPGLKSFAESLTTQSQTSLSDPVPQSSPQPQPQASSSSNNSDIEKLERLKKEILEGQNPIYKAVPQPSFLEKLYLGRSVQRQTVAPAHPDQITKSPSSSTAQPHPISSPESIKSDDPKSSARDPTGENPKADAESTPTATSHELGNAVREPEPSRRGGISPVISSQDESKVPPSSAPHSDSSGRQSQDEFKSPSSGTAEEKAILNHPAVLPDSHAMTIIAPSGARTALNESALSVDPPYDPKESLRHLENSSIWTDDRYRHVTLPYNSNGSHFDYVHASGVSRVGEQEQGREWNHRYGYGYDNRPYEHDSYQGTRPSAASGTESIDPAYRSYDDRYILENRAGVGFQRSASPSPNGAFKTAGDSLGQQVQSTNSTSEEKSMNGGGIAHATHSLISPVSQSASNGAHLPPGTYIPPVDGNSRAAEHGGFKPFAERGRQSSFNGGSTPHIAEAGNPPTLAERISDQGSAPLKDRIGIQIPLEARISTPPGNGLSSASVLNENADNQSRLEDRLSSRVPSTDVGSFVGRESTHPEDIRPIPTPLSVLRSRAAGGKLIPANEVTSAQQRSAERLLYPAASSEAQSNDVPQSRSSLSEDVPQTPRQGPPLDAFSYAPPSTDEEPDTKSASIYHGERRFTDEGRPHVYERPAFRPREASSIEDRGRPNPGAREWRERSSYPKTYTQRADSHPSSPQKAWAPNTRNGRQPEPPFVEGRDKHFGRESDRRPPPRSWDREEVGYSRPPPEAYPPPDNFVHDGYPQPDIRERPRIRGRSPSPIRRGSYGGPPADFRPAKRVRDEAFYDDRERRYPDYHARQVPSPPSIYYDPRGPYPARDVHDGYADHEAPYYDRRASDMGPPPEPPYASRTIYSRPDPDRYNGAPPRTA